MEILTFLDLIEHIKKNLTPSYRLGRPKTAAGSTVFEIRGTRGKFSLTQSGELYALRTPVSIDEFQGHLTAFANLACMKLAALEVIATADDR